MTIPTTVKTSFWLLLVGIVLDFLAAGIQLFAGILNLSVQGGDDSTTALGLGLVIAGALTLVFAIVQLILLRKMRAGRNWARVVITILEVLAIIGVVRDPALLPIVASVVGLVGVILMWVPASQAYFRKR